MTAQRPQAPPPPAAQNPNRTLLIILVVIGSLLLLVVVGVVAVGGIGAYLFRQNQAETQKRIAEEEARWLAEEKGKRDSHLKEQQAKIDRLLSQLPAAKDETERAAIQRQLEEARSEMNALRGDRARRPIYPTSVAPCKCAPGDPLCSCL